GQRWKAAARCQAKEPWSAHVVPHRPSGVVLTCGRYGLVLALATSPPNCQGPPATAGPGAGTGANATRERYSALSQAPALIPPLPYRVQVVGEQRGIEQQALGAVPVLAVGGVVGEDDHVALLHRHHLDEGAAGHALEVLLGEVAV